MSSRLPTQGPIEPCVIEIENIVDSLVHHPSFRGSASNGVSQGLASSHAVVDTFRVANILAADSRLLTFKLYELGGSLCVTEDITIGHGTSLTGIQILKHILDAWVSKNGSEATISSLVDILKSLKLKALSESLSGCFGPTTAVVFQCFPDPFTTPRTEMQNFYSQTYGNGPIVTPHPNQPSSFNPPSGPYAGQGNIFSGSTFSMLEKQPHALLFNRTECTLSHELMTQMSDCDSELTERMSHARLRSGLHTDKIKIYLHNLPEKGQDERIVNQIVKSARIPGVADIDLKRKQPRVGGWWNVVNFSWTKKTEKPKPLKVKLRTKKRGGKSLNKALIMQTIENTLECKAFNVKVSEEINQNC